MRACLDILLFAYVLHAGTEPELEERDDLMEQVMEAAEGAAEAMQAKKRKASRDEMRGALLREDAMKRMVEKRPAPSRADRDQASRAPPAAHSSAPPTPGSVFDPMIQRLGALVQAHDAEVTNQDAARNADMLAILEKHTRLLESLDNTLHQLVDKVNPA